LEKKVAKMTTIFAHLKEKNFLQEEEFYNLKGIAAGNANLLKRVIYKSKGMPLTRKFSPALRTFAITLHYYSPRAYSYVRETFDSCLPHPRTLSKWYCCVDGEPGFNQEALAYIKERVKNSNHTLLGALMLDEMAIRQHIEYDGKKFSGYCDVGNNIANDECSIAKEALVFLIVGINELWKIPVGYFLINGINGEQKANLVNQCLSMLHDCGIHIKTLTFDGAACNLRMIRLLQCNLNPNNLQTWFEHPISKTKIYVFLEPSTQQNIS